jgi:hypothetical protein
MQGQIYVYTSFSSALGRSYAAGEGEINVKYKETNNI